ncbi:MAG: biotin-dependent carboxyltransferase family protein [Bacteroidetes bacterium]|nr:biotin-dependent carboxyltransferase family protein [Bacteroidota bacterium]
MALRMVKPGWMPALQDAGRKGHRAQGMPLSGAMDPDAYRSANLLCGNHPDAVALELTLHGASLMAEAEVWLAHVGGGSLLYINDVPAPMGRLLRVAPFSLLTFQPAGRGCRSYLAMAGGFAAQIDLGSGSTYAPARLGGVQGRSLQAGDLLTPAAPGRVLTARTQLSIPIGPDGWGAATWGMDVRLDPATAPDTVRVLAGAEWEAFSTEARQAFLEASFRVHPDANRMGYPLQGPALAAQGLGSMRSTAVCPGTIQVTPGGTPFLLMSDAQTVGGYPRVAHIFSADLPACGQLRPGDDLRFVLGSISEAEEALEGRQQWFRGLEASVRCRFDA